MSDGQTLRPDRTERDSGQPTVIHVTKYDGSYHRRIPVDLLSQAPPPHIVRFVEGARVSCTLDPAHDPDPYIAQWGGVVYLFEDRWYSVEHAVRDGRTLYYVNIGSPVEFEAPSSTTSASTWTSGGGRTSARESSMRTSSSTTARSCGTLRRLSNVRAPRWMKPWG